MCNLLCTITSFNIFTTGYGIHYLYCKDEEIKTWGYKPLLVHFSTQKNFSIYHNANVLSAYHVLGYYIKNFTYEAPCGPHTPL